MLTYRGECNVKIGVMCLYTGCWLKSMSCIYRQGLVRIGDMYLYTGCWLKSVSFIYAQGVG